MREDNPKQELEQTAVSEGGIHEKSVTISRRKLMVSMGAAGAAAAASALTGSTSFGYSEENSTMAGNGDCVVQTTISAIRAGTAPANNAIYYVTDRGQQGMFYMDPSDISASDNEGLILVSASGMRYKRIFDGAVSVKWFGAKGDGIHDDTNSIQQAIDARQGTVFFPAGIYRTTSPIVIGSNKVILLGEGIDNTSITASVSMSSVIHAASAEDVRVSPFEIHHMTIDGSNQSAAGIQIRYRHLVHLNSIRIWNAVDGVHAKDTWLGSFTNCLFENCSNGVYLMGSNHRSKFDCCSFQGNTGYQLRIEKLGTGNDGNDALEFSNCDFEFSGINGAGIYFDGTSASFNTCYIGEGMDKEVFRMVDGLVVINGGILFYGKTTQSYGFYLDGGKVVVDGCRMAPQTNFGFRYLAKYNGGKVKLQNVGGATPVGGDQFMEGDPLDYGPSYPVFAERLGKNYTANFSHATVADTILGNGKKVTCITTSGANPVISLYCKLLSNSWRDGEEVYLVVNYTSNNDVKAALLGASMGGAPGKLLGILPNSNHNNQTYIKLDQTYNTGGYTVFEFYIDSAKAGDYIHIHEVFLADSRMVNKGIGTFGNLYKC